MEWLIAAGVIGDARALGEDIQDLLVTTVMSVMCTAFVIMTMWKTKAFGPSLVALIAAAVVWAGVMNMTVFRDKAKEDVVRKGAPAPAVVVKVPGSLSALGGGPR